MAIQLKEFGSAWFRRTYARSGPGRVRALVLSPHAQANHAQACLTPGASSARPWSRPGPTCKSPSQARPHLVQARAQSGPVRALCYPAHALPCQGPSSVPKVMRTLVASPARLGTPMQAKSSPHARVQSAHAPSLEFQAAPSSSSGPASSHQLLDLITSSLLGRILRTTYRWIRILMN